MLTELAVRQAIAKEGSTGVLGGVAGIYNRFEYLPEMRLALDQWSGRSRRGWPLQPEGLRPLVLSRSAATGRALSRSNGVRHGLSRPVAPTSEGETDDCAVSHIGRR
jgi:hypothetical protein